MTDWDLQALTFFVKRPGMYVGNNSELFAKGIDIFLIGYGMANKGTNSLREKIIQHIQENYGIPCPCEGFVKHIEILAEQQNKNWRETFQNVAFEVLIFESDGEGKARYANFLRKELIEDIEKSNGIIDPWRENFGRLNRRRKEWKGTNFTRKEIDCLENFIMEMSKYFKAFNSKENFENTRNWHPELSELKKLLEANLYQTKPNRTRF